MKKTALEMFKSSVYIAENSGFCFPSWQNYFSLPREFFFPAEEIQMS